MADRVISFGRISEMVAAVMRHFALRGCSEE
jgi:hypothetical protein